MAPPPKIPPSLALALGLTTTVACGPCLDVAACLKYSDTGPDQDTDTDTDADSDTDTDTDTDSDSDSDTDTDTDTDTTGPCLDYAPETGDSGDSGTTDDTDITDVDAQADQIVKQLVRSGVLPADIRKRLADKLGEE